VEASIIESLMEKPMGTSLMEGEKRSSGIEEGG
jgi:hypothetical protein